MVFSTLNLHSHKSLFRSNGRMTQVEQMVFSRGRCAKLRGEGKKDCPFNESSLWFEIWKQGFESVESKRKTVEDY
jgi:ribosome modulation factor